MIMMKTFKQISLFVALMAFANYGKAQILYTDLNPDVVFNVAAESFNNLRMDMDGDSQDDIRLDCYNYPSFGLWNLGFFQIDTANPKMEIVYDNSLPQSPIGDYYVLQLSQGDAINSSSNYSSDYPQVGDVYNSNFNGATSKYIGFRLKSGSDYKYGWMLVELTGSSDLTFTLKEYAYQNTVNTAINAGESNAVGITHVEVPQLKVNAYPNPASDQLTVELESETQEAIESISIYSVEGKLVSQIIDPELPLQVDLSALNSGLYILDVKSLAGSTKKMITKD